MSTTATKIDLTRNDYSGHAPSYDENRFAGRNNQYLEMLRKRAVLKALNGCEDQEILIDVGCGTGRGLGYLGSQGWQQLVGLDFTREMLAIAGAKLEAERSTRSIALLQGDAFSLPFPDRSASAVMSLNFLHMFRFNLQQQLIREMARVCRPDGVVVVELDSLHKGLFFSRLLEQRRVAHRTKFNSVWEVRQLFSRDLFSRVDVYGTALPVAYRALSFAPRIGSVLESVALWPPVNWLCERVIVRAQLRSEAMRLK